MGRLSELQAQLDAHSSGEAYKSPESRQEDHVKAIVEAVKAIELNVEAQEGYDYTPEFQALGEAFTKALRAHGTNLTKALNKLGESMTVHVEAPQVTVEAPTVEPSFEVEIVNSQEPMQFEIHRDTNGLLSRVIAQPYKPTDEPVKRVTME